MQQWRDDRRGEAGVSLIEAVIAVFILATAVVALIGGLATSIVATDSQRKGTTADAMVRSWADKLESSAVAYVACAQKTESTYQPAAAGVAVAVPTGFTVALVNVEYWDGAQNGSYVGTCPQAGDQGAQRVTLAVRSSDNRAVQRLQIVKRR